MAFLTPPESKNPVDDRYNKCERTKDMTIKEIENLSGMNRANIRFYEREGLIEPKRMDNGYRDYSNDDLQILLRIKLLRSLHISVEEIKAIKEGHKDLIDTLSNQIIVLEQDKKDVSYAQNVCSAIQDDRVSFAELDAKKYLDGIDRTITETSSTYFSVKSDELPQVYHPWRRFLARMFDLFLYRILWTAFTAFVFQINIMSRSGFSSIFDSFVAIAMMLFLEPFLLKVLGTTPGKAIFGLRIENPEGRFLNYSEAFERTWGVIGTGMGFNIPIYDLVREWKSYQLCIDNEPQPWDESISYSIKDTKWFRAMIYIVANAAAFVLLLSIISAQRLPPNRGELTIAEFSENYNYYARVFDLGYDNFHLDENGRWVENEVSGTVVHIGMGQSQKPEFYFITEDGYLTEVSFLVEINDHEHWLTSYNTQMFAASLALTGAQTEMGLFSKIPSRITNQINRHTFTSFNFSEAGIIFKCNTEYSGFRETGSNLLLPVQDEKKNFFRLHFSMSKQQ
jgi:DNA-binding transcriptional MerR regulator